MRVNIAVCGKFHYTNYLKFISEAGVLNEFYYSHKRSTNSVSIGVNEDKLHNFFLKEYLTFFHAKFLRGYKFQNWIVRYQNLWQWQVLNHWERCDILHTINHGSALKIVKTAKKQGSKILGEPVNSQPENMFNLIGGEHERLGIPYYKRMPDTFLRMLEEQEYFDYFLSPSAFVTNSYIKSGIKAEKLFTVPFGVNLQRFQFQNRPKNKFKVIYVAQITPRKAHLDLLIAWQQLNLPKEKAELVFVGRIDPVMEPLLKKNQHLFTYAGVIPNNKLVDYYNEASVFVMPSVEEGCSYAPLEAMACGLPVIVTENTGSSELVTHGEEGFIVPIRSPEVIAHYLGQLYYDSDLREEMSGKALRKSKINFGWERYASKIIDVYNAILPGS